MNATLRSGWEPWDCSAMAQQQFRRGRRENFGLKLSRVRSADQIQVLPHHRLTCSLKCKGQESQQARKGGSSIQASERKQGPAFEER